MNFKIKLKQKTTLILFALLLTFIPFISKAEDFNCYCANKSTLGYTDIKGSSTSDIDTCKKECTNQGAKYYSYPTIGTAFNFVEIVPAPPPASIKMNFTYIPMEEIPGFDKPTSYTEYVLAIYKFGLWTVGISAVLMISIGAFMYITSAGNTSQAGKARGIITDAIIGVILALLSYVVLYTINPNLTKINPLPTSGAAGTPGAPNGPSGTTAGYKKACPDPNSVVPIDYSKAANDPDINLASACSQYDFSNSYGVDPCLLRAMAQMESSCGSNKGPSPSGACGLMQLLPTTASGLAGKTISCADLKNDDKLSISLAAQYTKENQGGSCVGGAKNKDSAIFSGYNSGYECTGSACSPDKHALCPSGAVGGGGCGTGLAFECCVSPGGLEESINYAWNGVGLYAKCKK